MEVERYIKVDLRGVCCAKVSSVKLAQFLIHWWDFVLEVLKLKVLKPESYSPHTSTFFMVRPLYTVRVKIADL
jgi:hypothetical protein